jgi:GDP-4-dehydro-6-deoxy-D-mannose reductase
MNALITGVTGFVGKYLAQHLINKGYQVWGTTRSSAQFLKNDVIHVNIDLDDEEKLTNLINHIKPDYIFHLAGLSSVKLSWENKQDTFQANVIKTICLLEAIRKSTVSKTVKVLTIGSSEEYGLVDITEMPLDETTLLRPISPYGISKATVFMIAQQYFNSYKLNVIHARPFNHIGPGQDIGYVTSDFAKQIAQIEKGLISPVINVGNLESERDFTDVRDIVIAYELIISLGDIGKVYNVCSGKPASIKAILNKYIELSSCKTIEVKEDANRMRPSDFPLYIGDPTEIKLKTNWSNSISLDESLINILDYWRLKVDSSEEL